MKFHICKKIGKGVIGIDEEGKWNKWCVGIYNDPFPTNDFIHFCFSCGKELTKDRYFEPSENPIDTDKHHICIDTEEKDEIEKREVWFEQMWQWLSSPSHMWGRTVKAIVIYCPWCRKKFSEPWRAQWKAVDK